MHPVGADEELSTTSAKRSYFPSYYPQVAASDMQRFPSRRRGDPSLSALDAVTLCDFLDGDSRPTFILDVEHLYVAYQNHALQHHFQTCNWDSAAFYRWTASLASNISTTNLRFANRTWDATRLQQKYYVVNSTSYDNDPPLTPGETPLLAPPTGRRSLPVPQRSNTGDSLASSSDATSSRDVRRISVVSSSWRTMSESNESIATPRAGVLDWTKHNIGGLSRQVRLIQRFPWHTTPIGSIETWPESLRQSIISMVANPEPRLLLLGDESRMIYNEACIPLFGQNHPRALGCRAEDIWPEIWSDIIAIIKVAKTEGKATKITKMPLILHRHGYLEETFWSFCMTPIVGPDGTALGVVDEFTETTTQVIGDRRRETLMRLNQSVAKVNTVKELWFEYLEGLEQSRDDVAYAMLYSSPTNGSHSAVSDSSSHSYFLEGSIGLPTGHLCVPSSVDIDDCVEGSETMACACRKAVRNGDIVVLQQKDGTLPPDMAVAVPGRVGGEIVDTVCILPIPDMFSNNQLAFMVVALSPRRAFDSEGASFVFSLRDVLAKSASTVFLPEEHRRARQRFEEVESSLAQQLRATALEAERVEARYAKMFQMAPVGMYAITPDSRTVFFNDAYLSITGLSREDAETSNRDPSDAIHEDDLERILAAWSQCLQDKHPFTQEYRVKKEYMYTDAVSGEQISGESWVLCKAMPELDENGGLVHIQGYLLDVSDRKYHEAVRIAQIENERSEARFARLAETAPLGMYLLKPDGKPIYLNDAYFDILGFTREEFEEAEKSGVGWGDQIYEEDIPKVAEAWKNLSEYAVPLDLEYRIKKQWRSRDPTTGIEMTGPTWLQGTAVAEMGSHGKPKAVQGFVTEISLKKFSERLLAERLEEALETKLAADRFIDMTSHEMRNPLSAILQSADGILTMLETSGMSILGEDVAISHDTMESLHDSAQTIILCAQHQKRIVDDILTLSKLDSSLLVISPDEVSPPGLLERSFKMYEAELGHADIDACLEIEQSYTELGLGNIMLDSSRLLQVVINLLGNAIKFTQYSDTRKITIYLGASSTRPIEAHHSASMIEQRENRAEHTMSSEWGEGEDVYLQIAVEDTGRGLDAGELKLLFQRFQQASPKTYKQYGGSGLGLFISRELTELQGGQIGVTSEAGKGSIFAFYVKARRCIHTAEDLSLSRIHSAAPSLKPNWPARKASIVTVDATPMLAETKTAAAAPPPPPPPPPAQASPKNPLKRGPSSSRTITPQQSPPPPSQLHVLVVEDNIINQRVMAQQLRRLGCTVHLANHGLEALSFLETTSHWHNSSSTATPLSVILMDLEMPVLGGLECVKQIRELQETGKLVRHVPVIAVTANARNEQIAVAVRAGMDEVVTKPFRIPELVPKMEELVAKIGGSG